MSQSTSRILMIRPASFGYNEETAKNNEFQNKAEDATATSRLAIEEFNSMVELLRDNKVIVHVVQDTKKPLKPDAIFPNNWLSTHSNGSIITWPMYASNRRIERQKYILEHLINLYQNSTQLAYVPYESQDVFLEGTGSLVLDRINKIAYACLSDRTHQLIIDDFCEKMNYTPIVFHAFDENRKAIYHTNVMMAIGTELAIICMDSIMDEYKELVRKSLEESDKEIIEISFNQMNSFAGNMLETVNTDDERLMLMSNSAFQSLESNQIKSIEKSCNIISPNIPTIESVGGGSVRCMLCEIFLAPRQEE